MPLAPQSVSVSSPKRGSEWSVAHGPGVRTQGFSLPVLYFATQSGLTCATQSPSRRPAYLQLSHPSHILWQMRDTPLQSQLLKDASNVLLWHRQASRVK